MAEEADSPNAVDAQSPQHMSFYPDKEAGQDVYYKCCCDGEHRICRILERRYNHELKEFEYYVQFIELNSRWNDYYPHSKIQPLTPDERKEQDHIIRTFSQKDRDKRKIKRLHFGGYVMDVWYYVPLPEEFENEDVYCCEFCLNFINNERGYRRHMARCQVRTPPGNEIYRDDRYIFYEIDGMSQKRYLRNYCYLARMFLQHKTLEYDLDIFYFYVLYAKIGDSYHSVGYFSKEKPITIKSYNILSCILTMPCYQGRGYGNVLIDMAYMLATRDNLIGSPEKPLSDLGYMAFSKYWKYRILEYLTDHDANNITIGDIVSYTNFSAVDVQQLMRTENMLVPRPLGDVVVYIQESVMEEFFRCVERAEERHVWRLEEKYLHYVPCTYVQRELRVEQENIILRVKTFSAQ